MGTFADQIVKKLVRAATDEILPSVEYGYTGNYWINKNWNIFCEKIKIVTAFTVVEWYMLKLEKYDDNEECVDIEYDSQDTPKASSEELEEAIQQIISRNKSLFVEALKY